MLEIVRYRSDDGSEPYTEWFRKLRDAIAKAAITMRLTRLANGNFGDCKSIGQGIHELRIHTGPGYRIYFGIDGAMVVILLLGGDKSTQQRDITKAQALWAEWKARQP